MLFRLLALMFTGTLVGGVTFFLLMIAHVDPGWSLLWAASAVLIAWERMFGSQKGEQLVLRAAQLAVVLAFLGIGIEEGEGGLLAWGVVGAVVALALTYAYLGIRSLVLAGARRLGKDQDA